MNTLYVLQERGGGDGVAAVRRMSSSSGGAGGGLVSREAKTYVRFRIIINSSENT